MEKDDCFILYLEGKRDEEREGRKTCVCAHMCICVCVLVEREREGGGRKRGREGEIEEGREGGARDDTLSL